MNHTPGKWACSGIEVYSQFGIIAIVEEHTSAREAEANARLIAAAPQLLEACEAIRALTFGTNSHIAVGEAYEKIEAAIAAAKPEVTE